MKDNEGKNTAGEIMIKIWNRLCAIELEFEMMILRWVGYIPSHYIRRFFLSPGRNNN